MPLVCNQCSEKQFYNWILKLENSKGNPMQYFDLKQNKHDWDFNSLANAMVARLPYYCGRLEEHGLSCIEQRRALCSWSSLVPGGGHEVSCLEQQHGPYGPVPGIH